MMIAETGRNLLKRFPFLHQILRCGRHLNAQRLFLQEFFKFKNMSSRTSYQRFKVSWQDRYPFLNDKTASTSFDRHYVYHVSWAARIIAVTKPALHIDISSSLYFCGIISAFVPVKFFDYRPTDLGLDSLESGTADLMNLPFPNDSVSSISCMHVVEHIGLGRYGDPLDPDGDIKAIAELTRSLAPGGNLLFVVPVGKHQLAFNAHRIYTVEEVLSYFPSLKLIEFALIPDEQNVGGLLRYAEPTLADQQTYGCGCFWLNRPAH